MGGTEDVVQSVECWPGTHKELDPITSTHSLGMVTEMNCCSSPRILMGSTYPLSSLLIPLDLKALSLLCHPAQT